MKRQRNTTQMKEQTRNTEVQMKEEKIGKLPEKEFRIMIVKMIKNLENKMEKMQESINKDLKELRINMQRQTTQLLKLKILQKKSIEQLKQKNESVNRKIKMVEIISEVQNKVKRMKKTEDSFRDLWDDSKCTNI